MTKKIIILSGILLLVPACKNSSRYATNKITTAPSSTVGRSEYDEELGAFVVKDDDNSFSSSVAAQLNQEEELGTGSDVKMADLRADSAKYGLKTIYFEFDKFKLDDLRPDQKPVLAHDVQVIKSLIDKGYQIIIEGHACDSAGSTSYNMMLSEKRARTIKEALEKEGIQGDIHFVGRGCEHLVVTGGDRQQQAPNRRVEIYADLTKAQA